MITISLCMIVKDEELKLKNCLNGAKEIADEIIIVDTGSTDRTKEIAAEFTDKIFDFEWVDDFSAARNFSFSKASMDYIMWLDADDIILPEDISKLIGLKKILPDDVSTVMLKYNTGFDKNGNVTFSYFRERLVKRSAGFIWKEPVHEYIETKGKYYNGDACITHTKKHDLYNGTRNLLIYEKLLKENISFSPRGTYYYARELRDAGKYVDAIHYFESFLESQKGWIEDNIAACGAIADCFEHLDNPQKALQFLIKSFEYGIPRPEICCRLGYYFRQNFRVRQAAYWFELALSVAKDCSMLGFRQEDFFGYVPCIELVVCYNMLGENKKANEYNEMAAKLKPDCPSVISNRSYFEKILKITDKNY